MMDASPTIAERVSAALLAGEISAKFTSRQVAEKVGGNLYSVTVTLKKFKELGLLTGEQVNRKAPILWEKTADFSPEALAAAFQSPAEKLAGQRHAAGVLAQLLGGWPAPIDRAAPCE